MQNALPILVIVGIIALMLVIGFFASKAEKKRTARLQESLESQGFSFASATAVPGLLTAFPNMPMLQGGASNVRWSAVTTPPDALPVWIFEHSYSTGSGKNRRTHYHTVALTHCPQDWWRFTLTPEGFFHRIGDSWGLTKDVDLENPEFNKRWRVKCDDDSTVLVVLTPQVQAALCQAPASEMWIVGRGVFACVWSRLLNDGDPMPILNRLGDIVQQLSPEVHELMNQTTTLIDDPSGQLNDQA